MKPQLEALAKDTDDVFLRIVDVGAWDSAVAQQYAIRQLPALWLYRDGELVAEDSSEVLGELITLRKAFVRDR